MRACSRAWLFLVALSVGCAGTTGTITDQLVVVDPEGDDHGPGTYTYPQGGVLRPGALDLKAVRLARDGDALIVEATFHHPVAIARGVHLAREQQADLFVATVDIYLMFERPGADRSRGLAGGQLALPGRSVRLPRGLAWDVAVVLSAIPSRLRSALDGHPRGGRVLVPRRVRVRGNTLQARVDASELAGHTVSELGVAVAVTGTAFGSSFKSEIEGMLPTAHVREVTTTAGRCDRWEERADGAPCTFGGCAGCDGHPRVLDVLHPAPGVQEASLGQWDGVTRRMATLPMVWGDGAWRGGPEEQERVEAEIIDRRGVLLTIAAPEEASLPSGALVDGVDAQGETVATLVLRKHIADTDQPVAVLELVTGDVSRVVTVRWFAVGR